MEVIIDMPCDACNDLFTGDFLCVNVPNDGTLQYGVQFQNVQSGPNVGQTSVFYRVCNCNSGGSGTGISHVIFELCEGGMIPVQAIVNGTEGTITDGDAIFGVPNFKVENFGDVDARECVTFQLVYNEVFGIEALQPGLFGIKIGGGPTSPSTTGSVNGLLIPCTIPPVTGYTQNVTAEVCSQANVTITPYVTKRTPIVSCVNGPAINTECDTLPGFTPLPNSGTCTFIVSQVLCATIPLEFGVDVSAISFQEFLLEKNLNQNLIKSLA